MYVCTYVQAQKGREMKSTPTPTHHQSVMYICTKTEVCLLGNESIEGNWGVDMLDVDQRLS
jgi:hypothetical protein